MSNASIVAGVKSLTISNGDDAALSFDVEAASYMPGGFKKESIELATSVVFKSTIGKSQIKATVKTRRALSAKTIQGWDQVSATLVCSNGRFLRISREGVVVDALDVDAVEGSVEITVESDPQFFSEGTLS
ncbi:MAG: phage tail tube protein [Deltaproteobacteria bacterium]|nr:phage tail tube protein [Deltaproteobacteria bacterium]